MLGDRALIILDLEAQLTPIIYGEIDMWIHGVATAFADAQEADSTTLALVYVKREIDPESGERFLKINTRVGDDMYSLSLVV